MNNLLLYKTFILRSLSTMFAVEGILITTAAAVDIEKILANTDLEKLQNLSELKYLLSPLLCRNKEDQDKAYKIFDTLDAKLALEYENQADSPEGPQYSEGIIKENGGRIKFPGYLRKAIVPAGLILSVLLLIYFFWNNIFPQRIPPGKKINIIVNSQQVIINDTVVFYADVDSNLNKKDISVDWKFPDTVIYNALSANIIFKDTSLVGVTAFLKDKKGIVLDSAEYPIHALCELPPSVAIDEADDKTATGLKVGNSKKKLFAPMFTNDTADKKKYTYKWYVDDSLLSTNSIFSYSKPYNTIKLVVGCKAVHCSTDSMFAQTESVPALNATIKGDMNLNFQSTYNWKNILFSVVLLLLLPAVISLLVFWIILSVKNYTPEKKLIEAGTAGPYQIKFNDQQHNINTEGGIRMLADILRKRQVSDIYKLSLRKTIRSTVVGGGIPKLEFLPLSKPTNFLVFIDKEKAGSFLVKLFEYLCEKLQKEEVNIVVYEYFKEPLFLSNEKFNQERIPLEKIAALYPDTTLFIFGEAQYFLYPLRGTVKNWVTRKLNSWPVKILITPFGNEDWDQKEKLLIESNFVVLPADLSSLPVIDKIISGLIDIPAQKKEHIEDSYRSRFLNFQDFETLKNYLGEGPLLQWVCSLAIYPAADWDLTIAIGKAIEQGLQQNGTGSRLVNYTNLLKIARISWMQDGIINESLRVQMLTYLDKDAQALARETLSNQLNLIEDKINDDSLIKPGFEIHRKLNRFLLDSYHHRKIEKEDEAFIKTSLEQNQFDEGQFIYLDEGNNSLLSNPFKKEQEIGLSRYFKLKTYREILNAAGFAFAGLATLILISFTLVKNNSHYLDWKSVKPVAQQYTLTMEPGSGSNAVAIALYYEPTRSKWREQLVSLSGTSDTLRFNDIAIIDTNSYGLFKISTKNGQFITQDSFKLNSAAYNINIQEVQKIPLKIYYKDGASLVLANTLAENLPSNFRVSVQQQNFTDTAQASVYYFSQVHKEDASLVAGAILGIFSINIRAKQVDSLTFAQARASVVVYVNTPAAICKPLAITALPQSLNEIWHGGTSNRLLTINLSQRMMYYSVNELKTGDNYTIGDICLTRNGAFKIITKTKLGYKLYFIRNVKAQSFELSVCQDFAQSKDELENKDESYCDRFNTMSWYYATDNSKIYLPVSGNTLAVTEKTKLDRIKDPLGFKTLAGKPASYRAAITLISSSNYINPITDAQLEQLLSKYNLGFSLKENYKHDKVISPDPFKRNYLVVKLDPGQIQINNQQVQKVPDCSVTYTSLDEISKLNNPLIVCRLDLSKAALTSIPKELYTFKNMQEFNLGTTSIPQSEIDQLQKAFPKSNFIYQLKKEDIPNNADVPASGMAICTVSKLEKRKAPSIKAEVVGTISKGFIMKYVEVITNGESYNGSSIWYKDSDGFYYWGGGLAKYSLPVNDPIKKNAKKY
ncbi:MAG: hypothetical protein ABI760_06580 [Ferruginibacter sp.]